MCIITPVVTDLAVLLPLRFSSFASCSKRFGKRPFISSFQAKFRNLQLQFSSSTHFSLLCFTSFNTAILSIREDIFFNSWIFYFNMKTEGHGFLYHIFTSSTNICYPRCLKQMQSVFRFMYHSSFVFCSSKLEAAGDHAPSGFFDYYFF